MSIAGRSILLTESPGLVPFWTKRNPDYGSKMKTINCRDDSLIEDRGMWTTMKKKKRCIIVAQGFYEWLKKNNGKEKIPHFTKRKDGQLMCFAGLWDCVQFEGKRPPPYAKHREQCIRDLLASSRRKWHTVTLHCSPPTLHCNLRMPQSAQIQVLSSRATFSLPCAPRMGVLTAD